RLLSHMSKDALERLNAGEAIEVSDGWYLRKSFFDTVDYVVPFEVMSKIKIPVLIIHGDRDLLVPLEEAEKGYEIIRGLNDKNELYIVKGGDHTFSKREHTLEVINKTLNWLSLVV
ncbi:MAG: prolyl oligopeptidase family serine peptidase, partial [Candidatus Bathyarchaeia archaeon]